MTTPQKRRLAQLLLYGCGAMALIGAFIVRSSDPPRSDAFALGVLVGAILYALYAYSVLGDYPHEIEIVNADEDGESE